MKKGTSKKYGKIQNPLTKKVLIAFLPVFLVAGPLVSSTTILTSVAVRAEERVKFSFTHEYQDVNNEKDDKGNPKITTMTLSGYLVDGYLSPEDDMTIVFENVKTGNTRKFFFYLKENRGVSSGFIETGAANGNGKITYIIKASKLQRLFGQSGTIQIYSSPVELPLVPDGQTEPIRVKGNKLPVTFKDSSGKDISTPSMKKEFDYDEVTNDLDKEANIPGYEINLGKSNLYFNGGNIPKLSSAKGETVSQKVKDLLKDSSGIPSGITLNLIYDKLEGINVKYVMRSNNETKDIKTADFLTNDNFLGWANSSSTQIPGYAIDFSQTTLTLGNKKQILTKLIPEIEGEGFEQQISKYFMNNGISGDATLEIVYKEAVTRLVTRYVFMKDGKEVNPKDQKNEIPLKEELKQEIHVNDPLGKFSLPEENISFDGSTYHPVFEKSYVTTQVNDEEPDAHNFTEMPLTTFESFIKKLNGAEGFSPDSYHWLNQYTVTYVYEKNIPVAILEGKDITVHLGEKVEIKDLIKQFQIDNVDSTDFSQITVMDATGNKVDKIDTSKHGTFTYQLSYAPSKDEEPVVSNATVTVEPKLTLITQYVDQFGNPLKEDLHQEAYGSQILSFSEDALYKDRLPDMKASKITYLGVIDSKNYDSLRVDSLLDLSSDLTTAIKHLNGTTGLAASNMPPQMLKNYSHIADILKLVYIKEQAVLMVDNEEKESVWDFPQELISFKTTDEELSRYGYTYQIKGPNEKIYNTLTEALKEKLTYDASGYTDGKDIHPQVFHVVYTPVDVPKTNVKKNPTKILPLLMGSLGFSSFVILKRRKGGKRLDD